MSTEAIESRKVFISYSWTSAEHQQWVIELAERLTSDGVDVILDAWDLREGQDKYVFMEKMVKDKDVQKVLAICDRRYAEKADGREGGVGTESQIISKEVYESVDQKKFIPIVAETYEDGQPCLPTFFQSRIYIDMSTTERLNENYEKLVRNIYDKPLYKKPARGRTPSYILEDGRIPSRTLSRLQAFKEAVMRGRGQVITGLATDYLDAYSKALEDFRIDVAQHEPSFDERVIANINSFLPYRDEFVEFITFVIRYANQIDIHEEIHRHFEEMLKYTTGPQIAVYLDGQETDNFRFILRELFLYLVAALLKREKATELELYLERPYYHSPSRQVGKGYYAPFTIFDSPITSLDEDRWRRLRQDRHAASAELIRNQATHPDLDFNMLLQAELVLWLRSIFVPEELQADHWWPRTMIYARRYKTLDLFARATSKKHFEFFKRLFKVKSKEDFIEKFKTRSTSDTFQVGWRSMGFESILNFDYLDTRP